MQVEELLDDRTLVTEQVAPLLATMLSEQRVAYADAARAAVLALRDGQLAGIQTSSERFWISFHFHKARPVAAQSGALFQCLELRSPPRSERDLVGWIVVQDGYRSGTLVLVHEIGHFLNRFRVWQELQEPAPVVDRSLIEDVSAGRLRMVRAQLINEIAARHLAYVAEEGANPDVSPLPQPGALFACAVKIASYPMTYHDAGFMQRLVATQDMALLRDQVGLWFSGLRGFRFYEPGTTRAREHAQWLAQEIAVAAKGRHAPTVPAEGTL